MLVSSTDIDNYTQYLYLFVKVEIYKFEWTYDEVTVANKACYIW